MYKFVMHNWKDNEHDLRSISLTTGSQSHHKRFCISNSNEKILHTEDHMMTKGQHDTSCTKHSHS
jgi:hypothetical protein